MARSHNIFVVQKPWFGDYGADIEAAFTVKRELITWLKTQHESYLNTLRIFQCRDGTAGVNACTELSKRELLK